MPCDPKILRNVPLFALLDDDEAAILAQQVEHRHFARNQKIYKIGDPGEKSYILIEGHVHVTTVDEDQQELLVDEPQPGEFFGFASMIEQSTHQTAAIALEGSDCIEFDRSDILELLTRKPHAGLDLLTVLGRQFHTSQTLVRQRAARSPNEIIEEEATLGDHLADEVARFGGSWRFIIAFSVVLIVYAGVNIWLDKKAWDPYPFILLNLFLSMLAAIQAPVIMMSQNRQDTKDRLRSELDFEVNKRAESEIQGLSKKVHLLDDKIDDLMELLRSKSQQ